MKNEYGLDVNYFSKNISRISRDLRSYKPDEIARALLRLSLVADRSVIKEPEFCAQHRQVTKGR